jgi:hypothetical protein
MEETQREGETRTDADPNLKQKRHNIPHEQRL